MKMKGGESEEGKRSLGVFLQDSDVKLRRKERVPKCCVVGDGGTGKTSMMMRYTMGKIQSDYQPTCFENYTSKSFRIRQKKLSFMIFGKSWKRLKL